jgi:nucleoside-diphosphate-sugar epimerase
MIPRIFVTGGAGYVGSVLVPKLLSAGYAVTVLDLFLFGDHLPPQSSKGAPPLVKVKGDIRDQALLRSLLRGHQAVIHLACISNDPSFELDPSLSRSINFECFEPLVVLAKAAGVQRFIYASTSSVYGISNAENVSEDHPLVPLTDYNRYKGLCEPLLFKYQCPDFTTVTIRPATVCGYSPRLRLDLTVNILTFSAIETGTITVLGGSQKRPNIHIEDVTDLYVLLLQLPAEMIAGKTFNAGYQNHTIAEIAEIVGSVVSREVPGRERLEVITVPSSDLRSYHISSERIRRELGFVPKRTIEDAVRDLCRAFAEGKVPNPRGDIRYYNVKAIQAAGLR